MSNLSDIPAAWAHTVLGVTPHPRQAQLLNSRARVTVAACGRQFGKSYAGALSLLWYALRHPGSRQLLTAPTSDQAAIIFDTAVQLAEASPIAAIIGDVRRSPFPELRMLAGASDAGRPVESVILVRSAGNGGKFIRGHHVDRILVDEAALVDESVLTSVLQPTMAASAGGGEMLLLSTPFGKRGYFHEMYQLAGRHGDVRAFQFPSSDNPRISPEFLERQRELVPETAFREEYEAEFLDAAGALFSYAAIHAAIDDDITSDPVKAHRYALGWDPARTHDRSAVCVLDCTEEPHRVVRVLDLKDGSGEFTPQVQRLAGLATEYNTAPVLVDETSEHGVIELCKQAGIKATGLRFTNPEKKGLIDALANALEQGRLRIPRDAALLRELAHYSYRRLDSGHAVYGAPQGGGHYDDYVTSLGLALRHAGTGDMLPYWWLREDKAFCEAVNGPFRQRSDEERRNARNRAVDETDEQRIARRKAEYYGVADPRSDDEQAQDTVRAGLDRH